MLSLQWSRFIALVLFAYGIWTASLFAALIVPEKLGYQTYQRTTATLVEDSGLAVFLALSGAMMVLSYFVLKRRNWARLTIIALLLAAAAAMLVILCAKMVTGHFGTPDEIGEFVVGVGFLLFPLTAVMFLLNKPVVEEFT